MRQRYAGRHRPTGTDPSQPTSTGSPNRPQEVRAAPAVRVPAPVPVPSARTVPHAEAATVVLSRRELRDALATERSAQRRTLARRTPLAVAASGVVALTVVSVSAGADTGEVEGAVLAAGSTSAVDAIHDVLTTQREAQATSADLTLTRERAAAAAIAAREAAIAAEKQKAAREAERKAAQAKAEAKKAKAKAIAAAKADPKGAASAMLGDYGWGQGQMSCLIQLWNGESGWKWNAANPYSSAYGIPQSLPGSKMASAGSDWRTNPVTQIRWGLGYIKSTYGSPCAALSAWNSRSPHWY